MAQKHSIYVVLDMGDLQPCNSTDTGNLQPCKMTNHKGDLQPCKMTNDTGDLQPRSTCDTGKLQACKMTNDNPSSCPTDGRFQYNTLVAFSPDGELIAKYHKMHLYREPYYDASTLDPTYFDTSFGVRFAMLICFDMIFTDPARLYSENNITDVIFSTEWVNSFPLISALQIQQSWSRVFKANLLASGTGMGRISSGSGIYSQGNILADYFNPIRGTTGDMLLIAQVPKLTSVPSAILPKSGNHLMNNLKTGKNILPHIHTFEAIPGSSGQNIVGKSGALQCTFSYSVSNTSEKTTVEKYALIVYEAADIIDLLPAPFQYCGLVRCDSEWDLCGIIAQDFEASTVFDSFSISGNFNTSFTPFPLLFTLDGQLLPPQKMTFEESTKIGTSVESNGIFGEILLGVAVINMLDD